MFVFWLIAFIILVIAVGILIRSITKHSGKENKGLQESDNALYQQRLDELQNDLDNGVITEHEADLSEKEIQLAFINKQQDSVVEQAETNNAKLNRVTAAIVAVFIPVFVLLIYLNLGRPDLIDAKPEQLAAEQSVTMEQIEQMLVGLEQRLQQQPDDIEGWQMFYKSNMVLERVDKALLAAEKLYQLQGDQPEALIRYADTLAMANNGQLGGQPFSLIEQALKLDPEHPNALWLAGLAANQQQDWQAAIDYWERLLDLVDENAEPVQQLKNMIAEVKTRQHAADESAIDTKQFNITVDISFAPGFDYQPEDDDVLFVFARLADGPAMPIAVVRRNAAELPLQVTLDDTVSMLPGEELANLSNLEVIARISKDGDVKASTGDMYGNITVADANVTEPLQLLINKTVE